MQQLKMRLRVICNAIIDQGIHAKNMSEKEAMDLMMKEGFQQEGEAVAKWKRARLSSAQLSTYFVGVAEHLDLRDRAKAKAGTAFDLKKLQRHRFFLWQPAGEIRPGTDGAVDAHLVAAAVLAADRGTVSVPSFSIWTRRRASLH